MKESRQALANTIEHQSGSLKSGARCTMQEAEDSRPAAGRSTVFRGISSLDTEVAHMGGAGGGAKAKRQDMGSM